MYQELLPIRPDLSKYIASASYFHQGTDAFCTFRLVPRAFSTLFFVIKKTESFELSHGDTIYNFAPHSIYTFGVGNLPASFQVSCSRKRKCDYGC